MRYANLALVAIGLLLASQPAFAKTGTIPVNQCGQTLSVAGGHYQLTGNLSCGSFTITIAASGIHFDTNKFSVTSTTNVVTISNGLSNITINGGGSLSGGGGLTIGTDQDVTVTNVALMGDSDLGGNGGGVQLNGAAQVSITKCTLGGSFGIGGNVIGSTFRNNTISTGSLGPTEGFLINGERNLIENNTLTEGNAGQTSDNVGISVTAGNRVLGNTVNQYYVGIELSGDSNLVSRNTVTGVSGSVPDPSADGIEADGGARMNKITRNTVSGNVEDLYDGNGPPCVNTWRSNKFGTSGGAMSCIR